MKDAIDFLDRIEGHGYGGMADYEIARTTVRGAEAEIERLRAENERLAQSILTCAVGICRANGQSPR